jgi:hypothetical protein
MNNSNIFPFINRLSDHDAQYLLIHNVNIINFASNSKNIGIVNADSI